MGEEGPGSRLPHSFLFIELSSGLHGDNVVPRLSWKGGGGGVRAIPGDPRPGNEANQ